MVQTGKGRHFVKFPKLWVWEFVFNVLKYIIIKTKCTYTQIETHSVRGFRDTSSLMFQKLITFPLFSKMSDVRRNFVQGEEQRS